ncbi:FGGY-family carbohydrate kinase, partial [Candidatus Aerophobetes bacterium]|nr:FGGY-family carbohydrate kinase [Candidatus Aerophobetes bacterium]
MAKDYIIGVDCSTTAAKAIVWDKEGTPVAEGRKSMQLLIPKSEWGEQKCEQWWSATAEAIKEAVLQVDSRRITAIGITHQRESFVPLNKNMHPLRNGILWVDTRATSQVQKLKKTYADTIHKITGLFPNLYAANAKMMWLRENEPSIFEQTHKFLDVYAYLAWKLTGRLVTSFASACPLGLLDMSKLCWSKQVMEIIGVREEQFPELCPPGEVVGTLTREAASLLGLLEGVPVVAGGGDGQCAALGAGVVEEGYASLNLGTAVVSEFFSPEYVTGKTFRTLCGCVPGSYIAESLIAGGTFTISWFVKEFAHNERKLSEIDNISAEELLEILASRVKPQSPRLLMVPYWKAAAAPFWDPLARGIVIGWSGDTGRAHLYRAIMEGIVFEQKFLYDGMEASLNKKIEKIILLGGGAKSTLWRQILADITGIPVFIPHTFEATCLGAAMLAAYAAGM